MASKAKSGLSAVRQFFERLVGLIPPNTYVVGAASFTSGIRDGQGHSSIHASVTNNTTGSLQVLMAWRSTGPFVQVYQKDTAADPVTGLFTAEIVCPVLRRFVKVVFTPPAGLGAGFELGSYFLPRADSPCFEASGGSDPVIIADVSVTGNKQIQTVEAIPLLAGGASFNGSEQDSINHESFSASLTVAAGPGATTIKIIFQERASGAATFRDADSFTTAVPGSGALVNFNRVWSVTRQFVRVRVENTGANALTTAELVTMRKPIS